MDDKFDTEEQFQFVERAGGEASLLQLDSHPDQGDHVDKQRSNNDDGVGSLLEEPGLLATADSTTNTKAFNHEFQFNEISDVKDVVGATAEGEVGSTSTGSDDFSFEYGLGNHSDAATTKDVGAGIASSSTGLDSDEVQTPVATARDLLLEFDGDDRKENVLAGGDSGDIMEELTPTFTDKKDEEFKHTVTSGVREATPPPSPAEQGAFVESTDMSYTATLEPQSTTSTAPPSSDDRPVKMPKATTIAPPTKTAPTRSACSGSSGCILTWLKQLDPKVWDVLLWRNPMVTGGLLTAVMVVLFSLACWSIFSVVAYILLFSVSAAVAYRVVKYIIVKVHKGDSTHPFKDVLEADVGISESLVQEYSLVIVQRLNIFLANMRDLIFVKDMGASIKLFFVLCAMTYIGAYFNGLTVVILATAAVFTLPKVYEVNKVQIDQYVDIALSKFDDYYRKLQTAVPFLKKKTQ